MDVVVIGAVITSLGTVGAALITEFKRREVVKQLAVAKRPVREQLISMYGLSVGRASSRVEFLDLEGSVRVTRRWENVRAAEGREFKSIPGTFWSLGPDGCGIESPPALVDVDPTYPKALSLGFPGNRPMSGKYLVNIAGSGLSHDDSNLSYGVEVSMKKACFMWREDVEGAYGGDLLPHEYHSFDATFPTETLEIEVVFPPSYTAECFSIAMFSDSELSNGVEASRIAGGLHRNQRGAVLTVDGPIQGTRYAIYWKSPRKPPGGH